MSFFSNIVQGEWGDPYGGMLDEQDRRNALKSALPAFGAALLSQGYTRAPQSPFQGIGEGIASFQQARDRALQQSLQSKILNRQWGREDARDARDTERFGMEKDAFKTSQDKAARDAKRDNTNFADQDRVRQAQARLSAILAKKVHEGVANPAADPEVIAALAELNPTSAITLTSKEPTKPITVGQHDRLVDPRTAKVILGPAGGAGAGGPFQGNGMEQQVMNILLKGDPASPEYAAAYADRAQPRVTFDPQSGQMVQVKPDMSAFRPPIPRGAPQMPAPQQSVPASPEGAPPQTQNLGGGVSLTQVAPPRQSATERQKLTAARAGAKTIVDALRDFQNTKAGAGIGDKAKSVLGMNTPLNTSYNAAALLAKGEELFNLGVLNGPDLEIIRRTLPDPSTMKGAMTGDKDTQAGIDKVVNLIRSKLNEMERGMGEQLTSFDDNPPAPASGGGLGPEDRGLVDMYLQRGRLPGAGPQVPTR